MLDAGCRLKSFYAPEDDLAAAYSKAFPRRAARRRRARDPRGCGDQARHRRRHSGRPRADGGARHAARQGRDARQAGRDDARAARRASPRAGRDRAHPLDPLFRALHAARDHRRRRAGEGGRDRPRAADDRPRAAQDRQLCAPRLVLEPRADRRHPLRHRLASGRAVPVLHRRGEGRGRRRATSPISITRKRRSSRILGRSCSLPTAPRASSASTGSRRTASRSGATGGSSSSARRARSSSGNTSTSPGGRAATISSSSTARARATSIAPARRSSMASSFATTS